MKIILIVALGLGICSVRAVDRAALDQLPQNALQSAFEILRRDYIRRDELTFEELNRAALQGLLERLNFGAEVVPAAAAPLKAEPHVHAEFLAPDVAYLRPETMATGEAALFEKELQKAVEQRARHLILDLRGTQSSGAFEEAALMLQAFVPVGEVIFKLKQMGAEDAELFVSKGGTVWNDKVIVLIDQDTNNAAEAFAATLKKRGNTVLVGEKTRGAAVRYSEVALNDKAKLRYASAELLLPDGSPVFKHGVEPTHEIRADRKEKLAVFNASHGASMKAFVTDRMRPRFNERAFVAGTNPELDDYVRRSNGQPLPGDGGQLRDVVTQRALDLILSSDFLAKAPNRPLVDVPPPPPPDGAPVPKATPAKP
jgi:hypothetical protein